MQPHFDFVNWTPEHCKRLIHEYQQTRDARLFSLLLARYDKYLLTLSLELKRKYIYLRDAPLEDLYSIAIVGFGKAMDKFKVKANADLIVPVIKAYIKVEVHKEYKSKKHEFSSETTSVTDSSITDSNFSNLRNELSARIIASSPLLTEREQKLLELRYFRDLSTKEIAKLEKLPYYTIRYQLKVALKKIKNRVKFFQLDE